MRLVFSKRSAVLSLILHILMFIFRVLCHLPPQLRNGLLVILLDGFLRFKILHLSFPSFGLWLIA